MVVGVVTIVCFLESTFFLRNVFSSSLPYYIFLYISFHPINFSLSLSLFISLHPSSLSPSLELFIMSF